ncbi:MAG: hypothetical protein HQM14_04830 [SAR324 cluster bacterium]|nr:hypothetical protein [SAR324 cluster bacterium]
MSKEKRLAEAQENEDWKTYFGLLNSNQILRELYGARDDFDSDKEFFELLGEHWSRLGKFALYWNNLAEDFRLASQHDYFKEAMMSEDEYEEFEQLPNWFTIYRGYSQDKLKEGFCWTLDQKRAELFAKEFATIDDIPRVVIGHVQKANVTAYKNDHQRKEIIALSEHVEFVEEYEVL